jgi:hypothetical protein
VRAGISIPDARAFGSEEHLVRVTGILEQGRSATEQHTGDLEKDANSLDALIDKIPDLSTEEFQPEVVEMFGTLKGIIKEQQAQLDGLSEQHSTAESARQEVAEREIAGWFDSEVESLGKDFVEVLGKGSLRGLPEGSSQLAKRQAIAAQVGVLQSGFMASGGAVPSRSEIFKTAAQTVLHNEYRQLEEKKISGDLERRSGQIIQRASGKKAQSTISPEQQAAEALEQRFGKINEN